MIRLIGSSLRLLSRPTYLSMAESIGMEFHGVLFSGVWKEKSGRSSQSIVLLIIDSIDPPYMHDSDTGFRYAKGMPTGVHEW